jgi:autotransporter translocation and assembly factor TamB
MATKRPWRIVLWGVLALLGALITMPTLVLAMLATGAGNSWMAHRILNLANRGFRGRIEVAAAQVFPDGTFLVRGVRIRGEGSGPDIVSADMASGRIHLWALLHRDVHIEDVLLTGGGLELRELADGDVNIAKAFSPPRPSVASPSTPIQSTASWTVHIGIRQVEVGEFSYFASGRATPIVTTRDNNIGQGSFELLDNGSIHIKSRIDQTRLVSPFVLPTMGDVDMTIDGATLAGNVSLHSGDSTLLARANVDVDLLEGSAEIDRLELTPGSLRGFWNVDLPNRIAIDGNLRLTRGTLSSEAIRFRVGEGTLSLRGTFEPGSSALNLGLQGNRIDLSSVQAWLPSTDLDLTATVSGYLNGLTDPRLSAWGRIGLSTVQDVPVNGTFLVTLEGKDLHVADASIRGPAIEARLRGTASPHWLDLTTEMHATDLASTVRVLRRNLGVSLPASSGALEIRAVVAGPPDALHLAARIASPRVAIGGLQVTGAAGDVSADLTEPQIRAHLHADRLALGSTVARDFDLSATEHARSAALKVAVVVNECPIGLGANLVVAKSFDAVDVSSLNLSLPPQNWELRQSVAVRFRPDLRVLPFTLASGSQEIEGEFSQTPSGETKAAARLAALDLGRIPACLLPPRLALRGLVDANLTYERRPGSPTALAVKFAVREGAARGIRIQTAEGTAELRAGELSADLTARAASADLVAKVQLPAHWPLGNDKRQLAIALEVHHARLADWRSLIGGVEEADGTFDLALDLAGSPSEPRLKLQIAGREITSPQIRDLLNAQPEGKGGGAVDFDFDSQWDRSLTARLTVSHNRPGEGGTGNLLTFTGALELPGGTALRAASSVSALRTLVRDAPLSIALDSATFRLEDALRSARVALDVRGEVRAAAHVAGSIARPRGTLSLEGHGIEAWGRRAGTLLLAVSGSDQAIRLTGSLSPPVGQMRIEAEMREPPEKVFERQVFESTAIASRVELSGVPLNEIVTPLSQADGTLSGRLRFDGTLLAPHAALELDLQGVRLNDRPVGAASLAASWEGKSVAATVRAEETRGGQLDARLAFPYRLSKASAGDLEGTLSARSFDLAFLSGATRSLSSVAGVLNCDLTVGGTFAHPSLAGSLSVAEGKLAASGFGVLRDIRLSATLAPDRLSVERLHVASGPGVADISGTLTRGDTGAVVQAQVETSRFAVYVADQLRATVTSRDEVSGTIGPDKREFEVNVRSAAVELPSLAARELGPVALSPDIEVDVNSREVSRKRPLHPVLIHVLAPGPVAVSGPDLRLNATADVWARLDPALTLKGTLLLAGNLNLFEREFALKSATVEFGDPRRDLFGPADHALIQAKASHRANEANIFLVVSGRLPNPSVTLNSEPPLKQDELVALLLGGNPAGAEQQGAAIGSISGLLAAQLVGQARGPAPLPVEIVSLSTTHVEAGKRLGESLYLSAAYNNDPDPRANAFEARASYQLGMGWALDGKYGSSGAGAVNVEWKTDW